MAITAQNFSNLPTGAGALPSSGTLVIPPVFSELFAVGTATFTGDGATTAAVCNWIDGTAVLGFTPSAVLAFIVGGTDTVGVLRAAGGSISAITTTSFTVNYSTAIANTSTSKLFFLAFK